LLHKKDTSLKHDLFPQKGPKTRLPCPIQTGSEGPKASFEDAFYPGRRQDQPAADMAHIEGIVFPEKRVFQDPPGFLIIPRLPFHENRQNPGLFPVKKARPRFRRPYGKRQISGRPQAPRLKFTGNLVLNGPKL
jgi:hypothetical protein